MKSYDTKDIDFSSYDELMKLYEEFEQKCEKVGWNGFLGVHSREEFEGAYILEKPVTMLEVVAPTSDVKELSEDLQAHFYTCIVQQSEANSLDGEYHQLYVSRFKSLIDVVEEFLDEPTDNRSDLAGILFGYKSTNVAGYCEDQLDDLFK